jgi:hypothetical protein
VRTRRCSSSNSSGTSNNMCQMQLQWREPIKTGRTAESNDSGQCSSYPWHLQYSEFFPSAVSRSSSCRLLFPSVQHNNIKMSCFSHIELVTQWYVALKAVCAPWKLQLSAAGCCCWWWDLLLLLWCSLLLLMLLLFQESSIMSEAWGVYNATSSPGAAGFRAPAHTSATPPVSSQAPAAPERAHKCLCYGK